MKSTKRDLFGHVLFRVCGRFLNRTRSMFLVSHRPDFDYDFGRFHEFERYREAWIRGNAANNLGDLARLYMLVMNARRVVEEGIPGDFVELGVYKGNSAAVIADIARSDGRRTFLYDTFEGFDKQDLVGVDTHAGNVFRDTAIDDVRDLVGTQDTVFVRGRFPDSLSGGNCPTQVAFVHIDCDLYEPTKRGLEVFYPLMDQGGIFVLHDYCSGHWRGIRQAVDEFLEGKPEALVLMPDKSGTAVFRRHSGSGR